MYKLLFPLIVKDFWNNLSQIFFTLLTPSLFIYSGLLISILYFKNFEIRDCLFLISRIGILTPLLFGEFFLIREGKNKTYILTRSFPVSDKIMYLGKNVLSWIIIIISEIPGFILLYLFFDNLIPLVFPLIILALIIFASTSTLFLSLKIGMKLTFFCTYVVTEIFIYLWRTFEDSYPERAGQVITSQFLFILASILLLAGTYIFYRLGVRHFQKRDTRELVT